MRRLFSRALVAVLAATIMAVPFAATAGATPKAPAVPIPKTAKPPASAAKSFQVSIQPAASKTGGVQAQAVITSFCTIYPLAVRDGGAVFAEAVAFCSVPFVAYHVTYGWYNYGHLYATGVDFGYTDTGYWTSAAEAGGGTYGHRSVLECISIADNYGGTGYGCAWAAINI